VQTERQAHALEVLNTIFPPVGIGAMVVSYLSIEEADLGPAMETSGVHELVHQYLDRKLALLVLEYVGDNPDLRAAFDLEDTTRRYRGWVDNDDPIRFFPLESCTSLSDNVTAELKAASLVVVPVDGGIRIEVDPAFRPTPGEAMAPFRERMTRQLAARGAKRHMQTYNRPDQFFTEFYRSSPRTCQIICDDAHNQTGRCVNLHVALDGTFTIVKGYGNSACELWNGWIVQLSNGSASFFRPASRVRSNTILSCKHASDGRVVQQHFPADSTRVIGDLLISTYPGSRFRVHRLGCNFKLSEETTFEVYVPPIEGYTCHEVYIKHTHLDDYANHVVVSITHRAIPPPEDPYFYCYRSFARVLRFSPL
jgi:hypothetical protein